MADIQLHHRPDSMAEDEATNTGHAVAEAMPEKPFQHPRGVLPNPLVDELKESNLRRGVLIPLKTTQEVRQDHTIVQAYITRAPTKSASDVITYVESLLIPTLKAHHFVSSRKVIYEAFLAPFPDVLHYYYPS